MCLCEQDYSKSNEPISLKLFVMIGPTNRKNWLTFAGDPFPDTDSGSLFHFPHHCTIRAFSRFISISHTVTARFFFTKLGEMTDADKVMDPQHFGRDPTDTRIQIRINPTIPAGIPDCLKFWRWLRFALFGDSLVNILYPSSITGKMLHPSSSIFQNRRSGFMALGSCL